MATLALSVAGQFAGALVGGPFGATIGRALGALAGSAVDGMLFGEKPKGRASDIRLQGSSEGGAVPRLYGWSRLAGNIIWARELELLAGEGRGAKAMGAAEEDEVGASFAVAFCEGPVHRLGRIWADGQLLDTEGLTLRFYRGTEDQLPDGLIEATQGVAPAYRGLCYLLVEQLPLSRFGNRIPQLSVELCRVVGELEGQIEAVTVIPGATEFGYDPAPRVRLAGPGTTVGENTHVSAWRSDWSYSIDELLDLCPNLKHVSLIIAWFGDDLRCGACTVGPRVETADKTLADAEWSVMGLGRDDVPVVTQHDGGAAYGGTPSDQAVLAAIANLKARGVGVTLYPMIMMDIAQNNTLPDPYGGGAQASYPWRGRITCHPAAGQPGTVDGSSAAAGQVASFAAAHRTMMLHYAALGVAAGGIDALIIGSEMRGLTTVRGAANSFPFVEALMALAAEVRAVVGPGTKLTYAADWSEYSGYQPNGEKFFHLDPLWASPAIDAVGIDNYMPVADWRDGTGHLDAGRSAAGYDLDYLMDNIAGGEGYDWYYASDADRLAQLRSPITDGAYHEPWVWRFKDVRAWWGNWHHNRPGGVRQGTPTEWVPGSKPIWMTELGCGAVDKGANQPNIFGDPKSSESGRPYFSSGLSDPLMQRQVLRAHQHWWRDPANNPAGMVDVARIYHWTWDARPYPQFPALNEIWADGPNHRTGHWLTGRIGAVAADELAVAVAAEHGVELSAEPASPLVMGYVLDDVSTGREALEPLMEITGLGLRNRVEGLHLGDPRRAVPVVVDPDQLTADDLPVLSRRRGDPGELPGRLALSALDRERDYLASTVTALSNGAGPLVGEAVGMTLDPAGARLAAERMLDGRSARRETIEVTLPPSMLALEPGDLIEVDGLAEGPFEISEIRDTTSRKVSARTLPAQVAIATEADRALASDTAAKVRSLPLVTVAHLPPPPDAPEQSRLVFGAYAEPWPGRVQVVDDVTGTAAVELSRRASLGETLAPMPAGPAGEWDTSSTLQVRLAGGHLSSAEPNAVLAGANQLAVQTDAGAWEIIGFAQATLTGPGEYALTQLRRGLDGTAPAIGPIAVGSKVLVLDNSCGSLPVRPGWLGGERQLRIHAGGDVLGQPLPVTIGSGPALPRPPQAISAIREPGNDIVMSWTRADLGGSMLDFAAERYLVEILDGSTVVRTLPTDASTVVYSQAQQVGDFRHPAHKLSLQHPPGEPDFGPRPPRTGAVQWLAASTPVSTRFSSMRAAMPTTPQTPAARPIWESPAGLWRSGARCRRGGPWPRRKYAASTGRRRRAFTGPPTGIWSRPMISPLASTWPSLTLPSTPAPNVLSRLCNRHWAFLPMGSLVR